MVEYIGRFPDDPPHETTAPPSWIGRPCPPRPHYYRCTNLDENGLCSIYDTRPAMCRGFPYGQACNYRGCKASCAVQLPFNRDTRITL